MSRVPVFFNDEQLFSAALSESGSGSPLCVMSFEASPDGRAAYERFKRLVSLACQADSASCH